MVSPDYARGKLEKMRQNEGESVAQYHVRLRLQVAKCSFTDPDDVSRSKILQTMRDKKTPPGGNAEKIHATAVIGTCCK